jgi:hypothetical protein
MTDAEFLDYCDGMTETSRCGFVPKNIARLLRLAGHEKEAALWDNEPLRIVDGVHSEVEKYVAKARARHRATQTGGPGHE